MKENVLDDQIITRANSYFPILPLLCCGGKILFAIVEFLTLVILFRFPYHSGCKVADDRILEILPRRRVNRVRLRFGTAERASFSQTIPPGSIPSRKHISHVVFTEAKNKLLDFFWWVRCIISLSQAVASHQTLVHFLSHKSVAPCQACWQHGILPENA
jgi:hypothetical protein